MKSMKDLDVLVTGGLGFVGSNLAHKLLDLGANVTLFDAMLYNYGGNMANVKDIKDEVEVIIADVRNFEEVKKAVKNMDCVFHLAAQVSRVISMENPHLDIDINCKGTINVLEACRKYNTPKIVYTGSRVEVGEPEYLPVDEKHPLSPKDIYGIDKLATEKYCLLWHNIYALNATVLRLSNVYGPRSQIKNPYYGVINWFVGLVLRGKTIPVFGDGSQTRDYVYIDDVVEALILAAQSDRSKGEVFLVGSGKETPFINVVKVIVKVTGGRYKHVPWPEEWKRVDVKRFVLDFKKAKKHLGWEPKTELPTGILRTVEFYEERLSDYI